jgi:arsenite/tail-anchored protein-transporting ATPase
LFAKFDVPIAGYIVNRVLPNELRSQVVPAYLQNRLAMQSTYIDKINTTLGNQVLGMVPEMERDVTGLAMIEKLAKIMYG